MKFLKRILLWQGGNYRNNLEKGLKEVFKVLEKLNIEFETLSDECCCGFPFLVGGFLEKAKEIAGKAIEKINNFDIVITPCPACQRAFKDLYGSMLNLQVKPVVNHLTEFIWRVLDSKKNGFHLKPLRMKIMFHDPCELGRHMGIYEEPRKIISLIPNLSVYEPRFSREKSVCCGGGGLLFSYFPTLSIEVAAKKLVDEDKIPRDLDAIVTACPQCILTLRKAVELILEREIEVMNVSSLLARSLV